MIVPERLREVLAHGNDLVHPRDKVEIVPLELKKKDADFDEQRARERFEFLKAWLGGEGPFTVAYIGKWPDDSIYLYINGSEIPERRVDPQDFMLAVGKEPNMKQSDETILRQCSGAQAERIYALVKVGWMVVELNEKEKSVLVKKGDDCVWIAQNGSACPA